MKEKPIPQPNCPFELRVRDHIPMAHVSNVDLSIEFYTLLGFRCESRFSDESDETYFAAMRNERAEIMLTRASGPINAAEQAILLYMYAEDVVGLRNHLRERNIPDAGRVPGERKVGEPANPAPVGPSLFDIIHPFYMQEGELRVHDPDGYVILIGQAQRRASNEAIGGIMQIAVTVSNVEDATKFYRDIIGLQFLFAAGPNLAFLSDGSIRIMLSTPQGAGSVGANSILYFRVNDIEATHASMVAKGAVSEKTPEFVAQMSDHRLWIGFLRDPDNNIVGIMEEKR